MPFVIHGNANPDRMAAPETGYPLAEDLFNPLARGEDLTPELLIRIPDPYYVIPPRKGEVPEIFGRNQRVWTIKESVRHVIEELEPSVHRFIPVNLRVRGTGKDHGKYYLLHFGQAIDAVVIDETDFVEGRGRVAFEKSKSILSPFGDCVLNGTLIAGKHLWRGARGRHGMHTPFSRAWFCSDELANRLTGIRAEGWRFRPCKLKTHNPQIPA